MGFFVMMQMDFLYFLLNLLRYGFYFIFQKSFPEKDYL